MNINAPRVLEHSLHLQQPDAHKAQERTEVEAVGVHRTLDDLYQRLIIVAYLVEPYIVDVVAPAPLIRVLAAPCPPGCG